MDRKHLPFWLATISLFAALILPTLLKDGMFMDGLFYSVLSRNLAEGRGTFWNPHLTETLYNTFHEHPPLVFGIQSLFFRIFGDHLLVERFYSLLTAIITGCFITLIWKEIFKQKTELASLSWLPFLFWIIIPLTHWSYRNNMLENTMGVFTIVAVFVFIKGLSSNRKIFLHLTLAGFLILLGFLCKGFVALFPLAVVALYWLIFKNTSFSKMTVYSLMLCFVVLLLLSLILLDAEAHQSLLKYLDGQVVRSLKGERGLVGERYHIIQTLFTELLPVMILTTIMLIPAKLRKINMSGIGIHKKWMLLLFGIGVSASFPIMISAKQLGFYAVPSFPYFAIGFAIIAAPDLNELLQRANPENKWFRMCMWASSILLIFVIAFSMLQVGKIGRDHDKLRDIYTIGRILPRDSIISICPSMRGDWSLHGYFARYFNISLDHTEKEYKYYLTDKSCDGSLSEEYSKIELPTNIYNLYRIKEIKTGFSRHSKQYSVSADCTGSHFAACSR